MTTELMFSDLRIGTKIIAKEMYKGRFEEAVITGATWSGDVQVLLTFSEDEGDYYEMGRDEVLANWRKAV